MISGCISEMSSRYEEMGRKFTQKLESLESTSHNLTRKFEALQKGKEDNSRQPADFTTNPPTTVDQTHPMSLTSEGGN